MSRRALKNDYDHAEVESAVRDLVLSTKYPPGTLLLDGPPFVSGIPHPGTAWNKVMKDVYVRYRQSRGDKFSVQPGYDCHGLPTELAVQKDLGITAKQDIAKFGLQRFVERCNELSQRNMASMTRIFKLLGVGMDWNKPYFTSDMKYMEAEWKEFKELYERGLVEKGKRVFYWCPKDETVLSDYEVNNYVELEERSVYVKFRVKGKPDEYFLVWTTTPWTLPANSALMVNPDIDYVLARVGNEKYVIAETRLQVLGTNYVIDSKFKGKDLEGLVYEYPLRFLDFHNFEHRVVLSDEYVTSEEGTGIVHVAPAHGQEDFAVGQRYGLVMLDLVDEKGKYRDFVNKYAGKYVREANDEIVRDLESIGALFKVELIRHRYPVCWRCGTPLIMRPTEQWLIKISSVKSELLRSVDDVITFPTWLKEARLTPWLSGLGDWVVSRQRYWGTPIPIWVCDRCGEIKVIGSLEELKQLSGRDISDTLQMHRPLIDDVTFPHSCGGTMRRVQDVFDVWFDSGSAPYASTGTWPPPRYELVLEGQDQFSGWFASLVKVSAGLWGFAPYKRVMAHGMALDESGREMHKSLGNYVDVEEVVNKYGADAFRLFFLQHTPWEDVRFSEKGLQEAVKKINTIWNLFYFATTYMNLDDYHPSSMPSLLPEDRWILSRLARTEKDVLELMESFDFSSALKLILNFATEDLSRWYVKLVRKRTWIEEKDDPSKNAAYYALYWSLDGLIRMLYPFAPFLATYLLPSLPDESESMTWPSKQFRIDEELEKDMELAMKIVSAALAARNRIGIKIRHPLRYLYVTGELPRSFVGLIADQVNVKEVLHASEESLVKKNLRIRFDVLGSIFKDKTALVAEKIKEGAKTVEIEGKEYAIPQNAVQVELVPKEGYAAADYDGGKVFLDTRVDAELEAEALARELTRRVQETRKRAGLHVEDRIELVVQAEGELKDRLTESISRIVDDTRAVSARVSSQQPEGDWFFEDWDMDGDTIRIYLRKS
ncbi:MAG: isoleucine--tRNA ligase [Thermoprotei archaeon]